MFVACGIWRLADVSSVSPSSEQTRYPEISLLFPAPVHLASLTPKKADIVVLHFCQ